MNEYDLYLEDIYLDIFEDFGSSAVSDPAYADFLQDSANDEDSNQRYLQWRHETHASQRVTSPARLDESYLLPKF